jgi:hypothetical protein
MRRKNVQIVFFFNDTATTEIYTKIHTLSLHDALATEEIIYCRQKNIATSGKWVRNGKYMGIAWSCLKVLFQDQPKGDE